MIKGKEVPRQLVFEGELLERESTAFSSCHESVK